MSDEKVWRGGISNLYDSMEHYGITPSWMKNESPIVVLPAADYDALIAERDGLANAAIPLGYVCGQHMGPRSTCPVCENDALQARVAELERQLEREYIRTRHARAQTEVRDDEITSLKSALHDYERMVVASEARIATLEAELAQKTAECVALNSWVTRLTESTEAAGVERDTALADLATAREECERLRGLLRRVLLALIPDKALASDQQKKLVVESASTILDDVRKELKI